KFDDTSTKACISSTGLLFLPLNPDVKMDRLLATAASSRFIGSADLSPCAGNFATPVGRRPLHSSLVQERPHARPTMDGRSADEGHAASLVRKGHGGRDRFLHLAGPRLIGPLGFFPAVREH